MQSAKAVAEAVRRINLLKTLVVLDYLQDFINVNNAIIYPKHFEPLNAVVERGKIIEYDISGGRSSGKTWFVINKIIETVREKPNQDVVCLRANARDLTPTCKAAVVKAIHQASLQSEFEIPNSLLYIRHIPTDNMIYFRAYEGSINRTKGDEPPVTNKNGKTYKTMFTVMRTSASTSQMAQSEKDRLENKGITIKDIEGLDVMKELPTGREIKALGGNKTDWKEMSDMDYKQRTFARINNIGMEEAASGLARQRLLGREF